MDACVDAVLRFSSDENLLRTSYKLLVEWMDAHYLPMMFSLVRNGTLLKCRCSQETDLLLLWGGCEPWTQCVCTLTSYVGFNGALQFLVLVKLLRVIS